MNNRIDELSLKINKAAEFVGDTYDKQGNLIGHWVNYSLTFNMFPSEVEVIKNKFPQYNLSHLYSNYYIIGFNKSF